jgi:proteasome-associated ATPase
MNSSSGFTFSTWGAPTFKTNEEKLAYELKIAVDRLRAMDEKPVATGTILRVDGDRVLVTTGPQTLEVKKPPAMAGIEPGRVVRLRTENAAILSVYETPLALGAVVVVRNVVDDTLAEVTLGGESRAVVIVGEKPRIGDRVVLDATHNAIVRNLGRGESSRAFTGDTGVSWDDIGGLAEAKRDLIEAIEEPVREGAIYAKYGRKPVRGILLYGPPGTGKTMLGKAAATALGTLHGAKARGGFIYVKGPELLNHFVGMSESNIRAVFASARAHQEREGFPAIIFIDEADAIMSKRGASRLEGMERTIVPQFLAEMDGLEDAGAMVLLATNRADTLDPAIVRDGRIDRKILVRRPNQEEAVDIFTRYLRGRPLRDVDPSELAKAAAADLFNDRHALFTVRTKSGEKDRRFALRELVSGALIAGLVERATQLAIRRERGDGAGGLCADDLVGAIASAVEENRSLDHSAELGEFIEAIKADVVGVDRVKG